MSISKSYHPDSQRVTIQIDGSLTQRDYEEFSLAFLHHSANEHYNIELKNISNLDSDGIGMLLLMRSHVRKNCEISISGCSDDVRKVFGALNLSNLFNVH
ncbi:MAG: STAS domain-containing protein [Gammaproteobacteria bacterium]|nr:STAS domain-containing protein [Gammaproteobacteria bacterium]MDH5692731.1 STAS domain-containing protein [Gammaproteobacteria bacterium]